MPDKFLFPPFQLVSWVSYSPRCGGSYHTHEMFQELIVISGTFHLADPHANKMSIVPGEVLVIPPRKPHTWVSGENGCEALQLIHSPMLLENYGDLSILFGNVDADWQKIKIDRENVAEISNRLKAECKINRPADSVLIYTYLLEIFSLILRNFCREKGIPSRASQGEAAVKRALNYIQNQYRGKISLGQLARNSYLSVSRFSEVFRKYTGCAPLKYINKFRMEKASSLLSYSHMSTGQVAEYLGFESIHYFSRAFKKTFGYSPSKVSSGKTEPVAYMRKNITPFSGFKG